MTYLKNKKFVFFLLLLPGLLLIVASYLFYLFKTSVLEEKKQYLQSKQFEITTSLIKNKNNIKTHKNYKNASIDAQKALIPIKYSEGSLEVQGFFKEIELKQTQPYLLKISELKNVLHIIDEASKPQLLVLDFSLERCASHEGEDQFKFNTKLLKREFE
jgi:hypothetical protein